MATSSSAARSTITRQCAVALLAVACAGLTLDARPSARSPGALLQATPAIAAAPVDIVIQFTAADGTPLEAKLTVPAEAKGPVPVVFKLHGAGPRNYDHFVQYRDAGGQLQVLKYYDSYAGELARRGVAFFRMSKRGCTNDPRTGRPIVDRAVF